MCTCVFEIGSVFDLDSFGCSRERCRYCWRDFHYGLGLKDGEDIYCATVPGDVVYPSRAVQPGLDTIGEVLSKPLDALQIRFDRSNSYSSTPLFTFFLFLSLFLTPHSPSLING